MADHGDILVLGLGSSGLATASWCLDRLGAEVSSVTVADAADNEAVTARAHGLSERGARVHLGVEAVAGSYDTCIASPGIPPHAPLLASARKVSKRVISEIEFAYQNSACTWVAITGTNGKTTTTALVTHLLAQGGIDARAVGNIGTPAIEAVADGACEVLVAEVSSFQLALTETFHPRVAVLLNITPDHLDWHGSLDAYAADKTKVFSNLTADDVAIIDVDDSGSAPYAQTVGAHTGAHVVRVSRSQSLEGGAGAPDGRLTLYTPSGPLYVLDAADLRIQGPHNVSNALAALAAAHSLGVKTADIARGLRSFSPIAHRLEPVGWAHGAEWYNDSKATNPDAVFKAIDAFGERPIVLLLGGRNKGNDFGPLARAAAAKARAVVTFGEARDAIGAAFQGLDVPVVRVSHLVDAVAAAVDVVEPGDAVVLSPACASFDEFTNYEQRGAAFAALVRDMADEL